MDFPLILKTESSDGTVVEDDEEAIENLNATTTTTTTITVNLPIEEGAGDYSHALARMSCIFRADPFSFNNSPASTISETTINGQHGPLLYPPVVFEFPVSDFPGENILQCMTPMSLAPTIPLSKRRLSRYQARISKSKQSRPATLTSSVALLPPRVPSLLGITRKPSTSFDFLSCRTVLGTESRDFGSSTGRPTIYSPWMFTFAPTPSPLQIECLAPDSIWIPPTLRSRRNIGHLQSSPPFDESKCDGSSPLPPLITYLESVGGVVNLAEERVKIPGWPYHPFEWRGLN